MEKAEILLESGTNEIEIMEFTIYDELYGINVAKVREIMRADEVKEIPHAHPSVEGIFKPREELLTVIDLPHYLTGKKTTPTDIDIFMVTEFNKLNIAFRVEGVVGIERISWEDISKPDATLKNDEDGIATGIAEINGKLVTILDFEKITADIAPETGIQTEEVAVYEGTDRSQYSLVMAEDSVLLTRMIEDSLRKAGYSKITKFGNGKDAYTYLEEGKENGELRADLLITDIEMPMMDGHRLTKLVKDDSVLKKIPVVIFSSLITPEMSIKGKEVGADEQLSKPEIGLLVDVIDELLNRRN
ncbi:two-component system chemotaxis response regulator CheV [Lachnospiraceae bacterium PF1-21]|uniref:Stage 0 sporulation protein A homolog n=1 Tax=Ohessyouella blattaphilus TaxID=2949333 RepID=A0ABT1EIJ4_9FIRM|nr:chemotaxis protein [Ohessyouella blattaphilus]MCP1109142.1 chemotaxis protein [Ohessyouella blattaphilus]MCR8562536.1 chemotaxis protein [Ohessyouella blattaphilus]MDL2250244.1 chemotaxis protein [Lachnospiraceae bacterium OttesenSCG-928-J05]